MYNKKTMVNQLKNKRMRAENYFWEISEKEYSQKPMPNNANLTKKFSATKLILMYIICRH